MEYELDNFKIFVEEDYEALSAKCADILAEQINQSPASIMGFATGGTPVGTYKCLIEKNKKGEVDFSKITTFNLDEYFPINKSNHQSYDYFMKENLFNHVNVDMKKLNIPNGEAAEIAQECEDFENKIKKAGGINMQILGIGLNGHIGFNEPADHFAKATHYVTLDESTVEANARFFASKHEVPKNAITMGIGTIMKAKHILLIINGEKKAEIAEKMLTGDITPMLPASILQLHPSVTVVLDKPAAQNVLKHLI